MTMKTARLICGVGSVDMDIELKKDGRYIDVYRTWRSMLRQSYGENIKGRRVDGLKVCKDWLSFSNFYKWYGENKLEGFYMSRDMLDPANKEYSPTRCVFVPYKWGRLFSAGEAKDRDAALEEMSRCIDEHSNNKKLMDVVKAVMIRLEG